MHYQKLIGGRRITDNLRQRRAVAPDPLLLLDLLMCLFDSHIMWWRCMVDIAQVEYGLTALAA